VRVIGPAPVFLPFQVATEPLAARPRPVARRRRKAACSIEIDIDLGGGKQRDE
jgi:hypothetical protein